MRSESRDRRDCNASTSRGRRRLLSRERSDSTDSGRRARSMSTARGGVGVRGTGQRSASVHGDGARGRSRRAPNDRGQDQDEVFFGLYKNSQVDYSTEKVDSDKGTSDLLFSSEIDEEGSNRVELLSL